MEPVRVVRLLNAAAACTAAKIPLSDFRTEAADCMPATTVERSALGRAGDSERPGPEGAGQDSQGRAASEECCMP